jgi:serine protease Do
MTETSEIDSQLQLDCLKSYDPSLAACVRRRVSSLALFGFLGAASCLPQSAAAADAALPPLQPVLPSFSALVERVAPAVVSIRVKANPAAITTRDDDEGEESGGESSESSEKTNPFQGTPLERFFQGQKGPAQPPQKRPMGAAAPQAPVQGQGSGFFISGDGYIVTNNHVVEGAIKVDVVTDKGEILQAKIIGTDPATDLALLKTECSKNCAFVPLTRSEVKPGDWAIALGNPFGLGGTVTAGIVSARGRDIGMGAYDNFVQIDAPVNKGNSGGPTFNQAGEVIGVNTAIFSPSGGSAGVAFAIPAKTVENIVSQLQTKGHVTRGWLGVQVQAVTPDLAESLGLKEAKGALVSAPAEGGPAAAAGIKRADVIVTIAGEEIKDNRHLARKISEIAPDTVVKIAIMRGGQPQTLDIKLAELKDETKPELSSHDPAQQTEVESLGVNVVPGGDGKNGAAKGLAVLDINPNGKGADAGLVQGDVILSANGADISSPAELEAALKAAHAAGKKHALTFVQRGATQVYLALPAEG